MAMDGSGIDECERVGREYVVHIVKGEALWRWRDPFRKEWEDGKETGGFIDDCADIAGG